jgi:hypothetical protein
MFGIIGDLVGAATSAAKIVTMPIRVVTKPVKSTTKKIAEKLTGFINDLGDE